MKEVKFQTPVEIPEFMWETGYSKKNVFVGSCFTENVGNRMAELKYNTDINPFGILYNPISVANALRFLLEEKEFKAEELIRQNGLWHSFYHHGRFSNSKADKTLENINKRISSSSAFLKSAGFLFVTFGTAWIYQYLETKQIVSNCHKIPAKKFGRIRLSVDEIVSVYTELLKKIRDVNPRLKVIFTISPIRHWKDGAIENQRSKSVLILAVDQIVRDFSENCAYFPSYEIVMDELRDYRFYEKDMLHISELAVDYIWEKFENALIDKKSRNLSGEIQKINAAAGHRPINKYSNEYILFLQKQLGRLDVIEQKYPFIDLDKEKQKFSEEKSAIESYLS